MTNKPGVRIIIPAHNEKFLNFGNEVKMKCLVTGCAGFIGSHLVDRLLRLRYEIQQKILHDC